MRTRIVGNAVGRIHPEPNESSVHYLNRVQVLNPIGSVAPRHHQTQRIAIEPGQGFTVHLPGKQHIRVERLLDIQRLHKIRNTGHQRPIEPVEKHLLRLRQQVGSLEHIGQADPAPSRTTHVTMA